MNKRIKIIWYLSIGTMLLIFGGQAYWLYNQYVLSADMYGKQLFDDCRTLLEKEQDIRSNLSKKVFGEHEHIFIGFSYTIYMDDKDKTNNGKFVIRRDGKKRQVIIKGASPDDGPIIVNRLTNAKFQKFNERVMDSLLMSKGYEKALNYRFYTSGKLFIYPSKFNRNKRIVNIRYSFDPLEYRSVSFDVKVPMSSIINNMAWQLMGSILLMVILAFCIIYQLRIIIFQKRIDSLRHEFMKTMIYEMKRPPADESVPAEVINIGDTSFYYSLNELHFEQERVVITSRQAEILKLLAEHINEVVERTLILTEVWGDDSYSNSLALNVQITYLRRALRSNTQICIEAIMKKGYVLKV